MPTDELLSTSAGPEVTFATKQIQPPSNLYVTREEHFFIDSWNGGANVILFEVRGHILLPNGRVVPFVTSHTPNFDRTQKRTLFQCPEGFLLNMNVFLAGSALRGQCYVRVGLGRGDGPVTIEHQVLIEGYLSGNYAQTWPGNQLLHSLEGPGAILSVTGTQPGAGAEILQTVPTGARWRPIGVGFALTTNANVANRVVRVIGADAANTALFITGSNTAQPAAQALFYSSGAFGMIGGADSGSSFIVPFPADLRLTAGFKIKTSTISLQAGDQYGLPQFLVEEWIEI